MPTKSRTPRDCLQYDNVRRKAPFWVSVRWVAGKEAAIEKERIARLVEIRRKERAEARVPDSFGHCTLQNLQGKSPAGFDLESRGPVSLLVEGDPGESPRSVLSRRSALLGRVDLSYSHGRGPSMGIASQQSARLGPGSLRAHLEKDLSPIRLTSSGHYFEPDLAVGAVFLIETLQGKLALIRIEALTPDEARLRWILDGDDDGKLKADEAYWRGEAEARSPEKKD